MYCLEIYCLFSALCVDGILHVLILKLCDFKHEFTKGPYYCAECKMQ